MNILKLKMKFSFYSAEKYMDTFAYSIMFEIYPHMANNFKRDSFVDLTT